MIFALVNTFTHMFDNIDTCYDIDVQTIFNTFYHHIATKDLSILCFGSSNDPYAIGIKHSTMDNYNLPSWRGVAGRHRTYFVKTAIQPQLTYCIDADTMGMNISTKRYWKLTIAPYTRSGCTSLIDDEYVKDTFCKQEGYAKIAKMGDRWTEVATSAEGTVLQDWSINMRIASMVLMTHVYRRADDPPSKMRPLSLTEDCKECIVLPILLKSYTPDYKEVGDNEYNRIVDKYIGSYFLPVFSKSGDENTERYKAVGIYYLGEDRENSASPTFNWTHFVGKDDVNLKMDPKEILGILLKNDCHDVPKEFIIE